MITLSVKTIAEPDVAQSIKSLVLAFSDDPIMRWLYPQPHQYLAHFPKFITTFGGKAFQYHTAYCLEDYIGTALWFPPGVESDAEPMTTLIHNSVEEEVHTDLFDMLDQMGHFHPQHPHWYLAILGVEPTQQGKGYGSALLQNKLRECDRDRIPAYVESSKPSNIPFYERHGFETIGMIQAGQSPPLFPMIRYPK